MADVTVTLDIKTNFPAPGDFDKLFALEKLLEAHLPEKTLDGHDSGQFRMTIFILGIKLEKHLERIIQTVYQNCEYDFAIRASAGEGEPFKIAYQVWRGKRAKEKYFETPSLFEN